MVLCWRRALAATVYLGVLILALTGCGNEGGPSEPKPTQGVALRELPRLTDLDPDPDVVEVALAAVETTFEFRPGEPFEVWAYVDVGDPDAVPSVPGPLLEAKLGDRVIVHFENRLSKASTTMHSHGPRLPNDMDGVSPKIFPSESFDYEYVVSNTGTHWYHPHVSTDEQIERGLHGAIHFRRDATPRAEGERVLVLDDHDLSTPALPDAWETDDIAMGHQGGWVLVNGQVEPYVQLASGSRERWHFVNAANGRVFELPVPEGLRFEVVGWDGGALAAPYFVDELIIAPGERFDVMVDVHANPGTRVDLDVAPRAHREGMTQTGTVLMRLEVTDASPTQVPAPEPAAIMALANDETIPARDFVFSEELDADAGPRFAVNDETWPFNEPIELALDSVEVWRLDNRTPMDHPFHLHGTFFQVQSVAGAPKGTLGWKDTVVVPRGQTVEVAVKLDALGIWMFHSHITEQAERGMMGAVRVVSP